MDNYLHISNIFPNFGAWIGGSCKPSDKEKLTLFPRFTFCQQNLANVSNMLQFKEVPKVNSERWLTLEGFPGEEWRDIEGCEGSFMVSNYGRIKSLSRKRENRYSSMIWPERIRKVAFNRKGYPMVSLTINCKKVFTGAIHRLVAIAFIPNPDNKPEIDHINTIKTDNRVSNLRWATSYENAHNSITEKRVQDARSKQIGKHFSDETKRKISENMKGEKNIWWGKNGSMHPRSKPVLQFSLDGELIKEWVNASEAQKIYGNHVSSCALGKRNQCGGYKWKYKD